MISTKTKSMTPAERKEKVKNLRKEHQKYFDKNNIPNALYIPKMAYRPPGKDELHVSFFPSEFEKEQDVYTEFVSINYDTEDPKRTLYLLHKNLHWKEEYELVTSNSGFERHIVPVSELNIINDINTRNPKKVESIIEDFADLPNPDETAESSNLLQKLDRIADSIDKLAEILTINNLK
tara:strand:+ start:8261 stop:8797 length:537 start_codon:yes stop_codon:yes gene_type:complete